MAAFTELEKGTSVDEDGESQDLNFAKDAGAYPKVAARLRVLGLAGSSITGSATIGVKTATRLDPSEFVDIPGSGGNDLEFTISNTAASGDIELLLTENHARYLLWEVTSWFSGGTGIKLKFSIDLVLRD